MPHNFVHSSSSNVKMHVTMLQAAETHLQPSLQKRLGQADSYIGYGTQKLRLSRLRLVPLQSDCINGADTTPITTGLWSFMQVAVASRTRKPHCSGEVGSLA